MNFSIKQGLAGVAAIALASAIASTGSAATLSATTAAAGGGANLAIIGLANIASRHTEHQLEVNANVAAPINMVALGRGENDLGYISFSLGVSMAQRTEPFDKLANAPELWGNIRMLFGFPAGYYHFLTFADSGIESFADVKGRDIYAGPPNAAQTLMTQLILEATAGLEAGRDYHESELDFAGGDEAFKDGSVSMLVKPAPLGGAMIEQFGLSRQFRLLGIPEETLQSQVMKDYFAEVGRALDQIPPGTYSGQINREPVNTVAFLLGIGANKDVDEKVIYEIMSAMLTHYGEFQQSSKSLFASLDKEELIENLTAPLHAGAVRAYREAGIDVPQSLVPPEMN